MRLPNKCPSCGGHMMVSNVRCTVCDTSIDGQFSPCPVCLLPEEDRYLFDLFMKARGNLKEVQRELSLSYPTVRNRIEHMFEEYEQRSSPPYTRMEILNLLKKGDISVDEAESLLRLIAK